jgi:hypothetical protein
LSNSTSSLYFVFFADARGGPHEFFALGTDTLVTTVHTHTEDRCSTFMH